MEKFLSIPLSGGGHQLISATGIYIVEDNSIESCVYVMYKESNAMVKIYYITEASEFTLAGDVPEETVSRDLSLAIDAAVSMSEAIEDAIIHALQNSQGQVITTIHELPLPVDYVTSAYAERLNQIFVPKDAAIQA